MRLLLLVLLVLAGCRKPAEGAPVAAAEVDAGPELPPEDVGNPDDLFQKAMLSRDDHPGEAIRLYKKSAELAPNDAALQARVKEQLKGWETQMRDRARAAYLLGFELRESSPNDAARNFEQAMDLAPRGDAIHDKAKAQLAKMKR